MAQLEEFQFGRSVNRRQSGTQFEQHRIHVLVHVDEGLQASRGSLVGDRWDDDDDLVIVI